MEKIFKIAVLVVGLSFVGTGLYAAPLIGNPNSYWTEGSGRADGSYGLDASPGNITSGTGTGGEIIVYNATNFGAPTIGATYTVSSSVLLPTLGVNYVGGFANDMSVSVGTEFMEFVVQRNSEGNAGILWIGGVTTSEPNAPDMYLFEQLYSGTGISATAQTTLDLTWTFDSSQKWTMSGSIVSDGVPLWNTPISATASSPFMESSNSYFFTGATDGEVTNILSGEFTAPVIPEPSQIALIMIISAVSVVSFVLRPRRRVA